MIATATVALLGPLLPPEAAPVDIAGPPELPDVDEGDDAGPDP